ncbi:hypothetical protein CQA76_01100 [Campylobacter aviculae]|uniref:Uncharacterized protein n=1 Tax=Campylobacter aviculae TaxID=2510190 RepID=A0A4U7BRC1_9BACT|nr:hypothetical protein CQA76_01100 [Campylobacter aviculae]
MLLFFILWIVFDCIGSYFISIGRYRPHWWLLSLNEFLLYSALFLILSITSAFFFFKELVKISGMKIFFVVFIFLFICGFYVWFQPIANILINRFLRFSDSGYLLIFFSFKRSCKILSCSFN